MSLGDTIRNATGPLVKQLIPEFGSTLRIRDKTEDSTTLAPDNSETNVAGDWYTVDGGDSIPALLTVIALARTQNVWGATSSVKVEAMIPAGLLDAIDLRGKNVQVIAGFLVGEEYYIEQTRPSDLGQFNLLGLVTEKREVE